MNSYYRPCCCQQGIASARGWRLLVTYNFQPSTPAYPYQQSGLLTAGLTMEPWVTLTCRPILRFHSVIPLPPRQRTQQGGLLMFLSSVSTSVKPRTGNFFWKGFWVYTEGTKYCTWPHDGRGTHIICLSSPPFHLYRIIWNEKGTFFQYLSLILCIRVCQN